MYKAAENRIQNDKLFGKNATFNNISVVSWRSVLLVEKTGVPREKHQPIVSH